MNLPDAIDHLRRSIVQIDAQGSGHPPAGTTLGTGFVVTESAHVVTAKHVVDAVDIAAGQTLHVAFATPDISTPEVIVRASFVGAGARVIDVDPEHDLALLEVPDAEGLPALQIGENALQPQRSPARLSTSPVREGTTVAVSGYPLHEPSLVTTGGILASSFSPHATNGIVQERYLGDFTANPGNSGGPVYTVSDGAVIGVCVGGKLAAVVGADGAHAAGLTVIVPVAQVVALIERNGLQPGVASARRVAQQHVRKKRRRR